METKKVLKTGEPPTKVHLHYFKKGKSVTGESMCTKALVNRLGGLSLPRKSVVRLTDRPDMTLDVYRGRKTTIQQQHQQTLKKCLTVLGRGICCDSMQDKPSCTPGLLLSFSSNFFFPVVLD